MESEAEVGTEKDRVMKRETEKGTIRETEGKGRENQTRDGRPTGTERPAKTEPRSGKEGKERSWERGQSWPWAARDPPGS